MGETALLQLTAPAFIQDDAFFNQGHEASVLCAEVAPFWPRADWEEDVAGVEPVLVDAVGPIAYDVDVGQCEFWDVDAQPARVIEPVTSDVPALLLHGEYDPAVPPANSEAALANLSNAQRFLFPGFGHVVIGQNVDPDEESCEQGLLRAFLDDPTATLDGTCVDEYEDPFE